MVLILSFKVISNTKIDSLITELSKADENVRKVNILNNLGDLLVEEQVNSADLYYQQGLQLANDLISQNNDEKELAISAKAKILSGLGFVSFLNKDYLNAISLLEESLKLKKELSNGLEIEVEPDYLLHLSYCYFKLNDYESSINNLLIILENIKGKDGKIEIEIQANFSLSENYQRIGVNDKALEYLEKTLVLSKLYGYKEVNIISLNNIISIYQKQNNWQEANKLLKKVEVLISDNDDYRKTVYLVLKARSEINLKNYAKAKKLLIDAEYIGRKAINERDLLKVFKCRAELELLQGHDVTSLEYIEKIKTFSIIENDNINLIDAYRLEHEIHEKNKDFKKAYISLKAYNNFKKENSMVNIRAKLLKKELELESEQRLIKDSLKFDAEQRSKNSEITAHKEELKQEKITRYFLFGILALAAFIIFIVIKNFNRKKKDNQIIFEQKEETEKQQILLHIKNKELQSKATLFKILQICSTDVTIKSILKETLSQLLNDVSIGGNGKGYVLLEKEAGVNTIEVISGLTEKEIVKLKNTKFDICICGEKYTSHKVELCTKNVKLNHFNVPIVNNSEVLGVIVLETKLNKAEMQNAVSFLTSAGVLIGETIDRHNMSLKLRMAHIENTIKKKELNKAHKAVNSALKSQEAINGLTHAIIRNENIGEKVYNYITDVFGGIVIKRLNITLFDFTKNKAEFYFLREEGEDKIADKPFSLNVFSDETLDLLKENKKVIVQSIKDKKNISLSDEQMLKNNINSFVSHPLMFEGKLLGSLNISFEKSISFTKEQDEFLNMLVEGITIAINQNILFNEVSLKNSELSRLQNELNSSLEYSKQIQKSILPTDKKFQDIFPKHFVILQQKDTVGGDLYWIRKYEDGTKMIACIDCTGHNVPGAFMTMISRVLIREAATIKGLRKPNEILKSMDGALRRVLKQNSYDAMQDGMDMTVCVINEDNDIIDISSAQRPIIYKQKVEQELTVIKGSRFPVGGYSEVEKVYTNLSLKLSDIEKVYMFSDGYTDQFGGPNVKKIGSKKAIKSLNLIMGLPMNAQKEYLMNEFNNWKGELDQIDDICIMGIDLT